MMNPPTAKFQWQTRLYGRSKSGSRLWWHSLPLKNDVSEYDMHDIWIWISSLTQFHPRAASALTFSHETILTGRYFEYRIQALLCCSPMELCPGSGRHCNCERFSRREPMMRLCYDNLTPADADMNLWTWKRINLKPGPVWYRYLWYTGDRAGWMTHPQWIWILIWTNSANLLFDRRSGWW